MEPKALHTKLCGCMIDLVPLSKAHTPAVVRLRNSPHVRAFFDEKNLATEESQNAFFDSYIQKRDDLYWAVCLKDSAVIGTNRLNEIANASGEKGSQTIDAAYALRGPYALEAEILLLDFAFEVLGLDVVRATIRPDNQKVISMNLKLGFEKIGVRELRGTVYSVFALERGAYHPAPHQELIRYFSKRRKS